jgi:hypothetical protein
VRVTYGKMRILGDNVGQVVDIGGVPVVMPEYRDRLQYFTLDVSYFLRMGPLTSGLFAGIGGYGIRPESISPELDFARDQRERVFGWNAGADGELHLYRGLAMVGRVTVHGILSETKRYLLVTSVGLVYRF